MRKIFSGKIIVSVMILLSFILLIVTSFYFIKKTSQFRELDPLEVELMTKEELVQHIYETHTTSLYSYYFLIPVFGFFGVAVGAGVYFILSSDFERKKSKVDLKPVLTILDEYERKVILKLIEEKGKIHQSDVTYMSGFNKVKAHRVIEGLVKKGVVSKENFGKTRVIKLKKELMDIFNE